MENDNFVISIPRIAWKSFLGFRFLLILLSAILFAGACYWWFSIHPYLWILNGRVEAYAPIFSSSVEGRIVEVGPESGEVVKKGELLFALDSELTRAKQKLLQLSVDALNEQIRIEKLRFEKAMEDYVSASSETEMGMEISDGLRKHLSLLEEAQTKTEKAIRELQTANAELAILELQERNTRMEAPFDGIVLSCASNVGAVVPFGHPVYSVYDPKRVWIEAEIPETQIKNAEIGSAVRVRLPAFPKKEWKGKVVSLSPSASEGTLQVKISLEDKTLSLKPGLTAEVAFKVH